jgi:hypothetical protein
MPLRREASQTLLERFEDHHTASEPIYHIDKLGEKVVIACCSTLRGNWGNTL